MQTMTKIKINIYIYIIFFNFTNLLLLCSKQINLIGI